MGGGDRGTRTPNLGIANAALSQLSYIPRAHFWYSNRSNHSNTVSIEMEMEVASKCEPTFRLPDKGEETLIAG